MHDDMFDTAGVQPFAKAGIRPAAIRRAVQEIRNHPHLARDSERGDRVGPQALRDGGDGVGLLDRESDHVPVGRVAADVGDIGAVQGGDHPGWRRIALGLQNLVREVRGRRMGHCVMRMNDIEAMIPGNADDRIAEGEQVLRLPEQRVRRDFDALEREPGNAIAPPERLVAADHVDLMAAIRERVRELGGHHPAAAERRVADDADLHRTCFRSVVRSNGSLTMTPSAKATPASAPNCASRLSMSC
jgi:hypothetical protein